MIYSFNNIEIGFQIQYIERPSKQAENSYECCFPHQKETGRKSLRN